MHFELITPERVVFREEVEQVTLPTAMGEITLLPRHIPLVANLIPGIIRLKKNREEDEIAVSGGFIEVGQDKIKVLADTAERGHELDISVIEAAKERAEKVMREAVRQDDASYAAAAAALERELARYKVAKKYRSPRRTPTMDAVNLPADENPV